MHFGAKIAKQVAFYLVIALALSVLTRIAVIRAMSLFASTPANRINTNSSPGQGSPSGQIREAGLVNGNSGWALVGNKLFWTDNNGALWSDITPAAANIRIDAVQFSSALVGGAVVGERGQGQQQELAFLFTADGGHNWTSHPVSAATETDLERYARSA